MQKKPFGRIAKFIAESGVCSRREAERVIAQGRVKLAGQVVQSPALNVSLDDVVEVDGKVVKPVEKPRLWLYYKPAGLITTHNDPQKRPTVFEALKNYLPRVISIGRLDLNSEGLLLLTNNGMLARKFELPESKIERVYKVRAHGNPSGLIKYFAKTHILKIDDITYNIKKIKLISEGSSNSWFEITLAEGKNREIRKIFEHFTLKVNRLIRTQYGDYKLGDLKVGELREVSIVSYLTP